MYNFKIEQLKYLPQRSNETWQGGLIRMPSWVADKGVKTLFIEPGSPWENGYNASFNGKLPDELLHPEIFDTLLEVKVLIERWRRHYNTARPHSSLGYRPPHRRRLRHGRKTPGLRPSAWRPCLSRSKR